MSIGLPYMSIYGEVADGLGSPAPGAAGANESKTTALLGNLTDVQKKQGAVAAG